jgi:hypothetical protein
LRKKKISLRLKARKNNYKNKEMPLEQKKKDGVNGTGNGVPVSLNSGSTEQTANQEVKKTEVKNPDGSVTYRQSWSSSTPGSSSSSKNVTPAKKAVSNTKAVTPAKKVASNTTVTKRVTPPTSTSGQREITSIAPMKTAGIVNKSEITAPKATPRTLTPREQQKLKVELVTGKKKIEVQDYEEQNPGRKYYSDKKVDNSYVTPDYVGKRVKTKAKKCTTC